MRLIFFLFFYSLFFSLFFFVVVVVYRFLFGDDSVLLCTCSIIIIIRFHFDLSCLHKSFNRWLNFFLYLEHALFSLFFCFVSTIFFSVDYHMLSLYKSSSSSSSSLFLSHSYYSQIQLHIGHFLISLYRLQISSLFCLSTSRYLDTS